MRVIRSAFITLLTAPVLYAQGAWIDFGAVAPGESLHQTHLNWIEIHGFSVESTKPLPNAVGAFSFLKKVDRASPKLFGLVTQGEIVSPVRLDLTRIMSKGEKSYYQLELEDVLVTNLTVSSSSGSSPMEETVSIQFKKISYTYVPDGGTANTVNFDYGSVTVNPDSDNDGMPDAWETLHGLNVGTNDANGDADGDGLSNLNEYLLGTDPKSGTSFFKATLAPSAIENKLVLGWNTVSGKTYLVQWTADLNQPFSTVQEVTATSTTSSIQVDRSTAAGFYRVTLKP